MSTRSRASRAAAAILACAALVVGTSLTYDSVESAAAQSAYPPPGEFATLASGHRMHYVCAGHGEPELVLFAGFGGDVLDWSPIIPALSQSHRVCAIDRLGQGWSDYAELSDSTFDTLADQMHEAITIAGIRRPIVVGHSLGGVADAVLARLGTYQSLAPIGRVGLLRPIAGMMVDPAYPTDLRDQMFAMRARSSALGAVAQEGAVAASSAGPQLRAAEEVLRAGRVPVLVIGAGATDVPQLPAGAFGDAQRAFAQQIPGAEFVVVADARHYVMAERPDEVSGLLGTWLEAHFSLAV
jgi:pimeloyl-ACP methyl ester carboxylesterase